MTATIHTFVLLLVVLAAVAVVARRVGTAPSILLVIVGVVVGLVPGLPRVQLAPEFVLSRCHVDGGAREAWLDRPLRGGDLAPSGERLRPEFAKGAAGDQVALDVEVVVDGGMGGKEPLRRAR